MFDGKSHTVDMMESRANLSTAENTTCMLIILCFSEKYTIVNIIHNK